MTSYVIIDIDENELYKNYKNELYKDHIISYLKNTFGSGYFVCKFHSTLMSGIVSIGFEYTRNNKLCVNFGESGKLEKFLNTYFKDYFDLEEEMKKLTVKEYKCNASNYKLTYDHSLKKIDKMFNSTCSCPNDIYFTEDSLDNFLEKIKNKNITANEFFDTYKKVFGGK